MGSTVMGSTVIGARIREHGYGSTDTARLAQLVEHRSYEPKVTGSSPVSSIARVAQWLAYRSSKPGVAGSSPAVGILFKKVLLC